MANLWQLAEAVHLRPEGFGGMAFHRRRGIHGCAAGRRTCTVWPDGRVTPCSFLPDLTAGNVRTQPFAEIWQRGHEWELLRHPGARPQGNCRDCPAAAPCGGARCIARYEQGDLLAGDVECPGCLCSPAHAVI